MKYLSIGLGMMLMMAGRGQAAIYDSGTISVGQSIGNVPVSSFVDVDMGSGLQISSIVLTLNITGGYNGNLTAKLSFNGVLLNLFQQPGGLGYNIDPGFNVTLSDGAPGIQSYTPSGSQVTGTSAPNDGTMTFASAYGGMNPNGEWALIISDATGSGTSTLNGWSLNVEAVPEPVNVALGIFGGVLGLAVLRQKFGKSARLRLALARQGAETSLGQS